VPYYTEPLNLGSDINTAGNDMYGFLATDNKTLLCKAVAPRLG
jgi:hypothetical protein